MVIGVGGFIGRALCEGLLDRGDAVFGVGPGDTVGHPNLTRHPDRIRDSGQVADLLMEDDVVYDAVGITTPSILKHFSSEAALDELRLHAALLDGAIRARVRTVVLISSGGTVYGDPRSREPIAEDHPVAPSSPYGVVKVQTEEMFKAATRMGLATCVICRLTNPYGPGQISRRAQGLVATVFQNMVESRPIHIWGDGRAIRDYVYIDDARDALILSPTLPAGSVCHVSSGVGLSTRDVVADVARTIGRVSDPIYESDRPAGVPYSVLSNDYLRSATSWFPRIPWKVGLERTAAWWQGRSVASENGRRPG